VPPPSASAIAHIAIFVFEAILIAIYILLKLPEGFCRSRRKPALYCTVPAFFFLCLTNRIRINLGRHFCCGVVQEQRFFLLLSAAIFAGVAQLMLVARFGITDRTRSFSWIDWPRGR
jgi:hypothetical protein